MPSYIELDKQGSFPASSDVGKLILGFNNDGSLQATDNNGQSFNVSPPYKVYTALLTQNGGSNQDTQNNGATLAGRTYQIVSNSDGDFGNVGAPNNHSGTYFVANGGTPNNYGSAELQYDTGAPVVTVLENTIGNIWWVYDDIGIYSIYSDGLFTVGKTMVQGTTFYTADLDNSLTINSSVDSNSINEIVLNKVSGNNNRIDGYLYSPGVPIEIRVYN
jgi:hypothetical protein